MALSILKNRCPYCKKKLNENGDCPTPCYGGALLIEQKRLQAEIDKQKEQDKSTTEENEVSNNG